MKIGYRPSPQSPHPGLSMAPLLTRQRNYLFFLLAGAFFLGFALAFFLAGFAFFFVFALAAFALTLATISAAFAFLSCESNVTTFFAAATASFFAFANFFFACANLYWICFAVAILPPFPMID